LTHGITNGSAHCKNYSFILKFKNEKEKKRSGSFPHWETAEHGLPSLGSLSHGDDPIYFVFFKKKKKIEEKTVILEEAELLVMPRVNRQLVMWINVWIDGFCKTI
jgi:hypothetical protein